MTEANRAPQFELSLKERAAMRREQAVMHCKMWRKLIREGHGQADLLRTMIRQEQVSLLKLRTFRETGIWPHN